MTSAGQIEQARACLRRKDPPGALACLAQAPYVPQSILAYVQGHRLPPARLERVLRWLTREELSAAQESLDRGDFPAAKQACRAALKLDRRGTLCALLMAMALVGECADTVRRNPEASPADLRPQLQRARRWTVAAALDDSLRTRTGQLAALLDARLAEVDRAEQLRDTQEVDALIGRYHKILDVYPTRITRTQAHNMRASLATLTVDVATLARRLPADPRLAELTRAIAFIRAQLRAAM